MFLNVYLLSTSGLLLPLLTAYAATTWELEGVLQQTQDVEEMLFQRWSAVADGGPTLNIDLTACACWDISNSSVIIKTKWASTMSAIIFDISTCVPSKLCVWSYCF